MLSASREPSGPAVRGPAAGVIHASNSGERGGRETRGLGGGMPEKEENVGTGSKIMNGSDKLFLFFYLSFSLKVHQCNLYRFDICQRCIKAATVNACGGVVFIWVFV